MESWFLLKILFNDPQLLPMHYLGLALTEVSISRDKDWKLCVALLKRSINAFSRGFTDLQPQSPIKGRTVM